MKKAEAQQYWMEKADEALQSARSEQHARGLVFAINRLCKVIDVFGCDTSIAVEVKV